MKDLRLLFLDGPLKGNAFPLNDTANVGRYRDNDIVIPSPHVSRHHARVMRTGEEVVIQDLSSRNGTWVNGQKISMLLLRIGDRICLGDVILELVDTIEHQEPQTLPPDIAVALSSPPSERDTGDEWSPSPDFAGYKGLTELFRNSAGVFCVGLHPQFGETNAFVYHPGLCANTAFRRLARFEAQNRLALDTEFAPRLLEANLHDGILCLVYEKANGERFFSSTYSRGKWRKEDAILILLEQGTDLIRNFVRLKKSHCCICNDSLFLDENNRIHFSCAGVLKPSHLDRQEDIPPFKFDLRDLCITAFHFKSDRRVRDDQLSWESISGLVEDPLDSGEPVLEALSLVLGKGMCVTGKPQYDTLGEFIRDILDIKRGRSREVYTSITEQVRIRNV